VLFLSVQIEYGAKSAELFCLPLDNSIFSFEIIIYRFCEGCFKLRRESFDNNYWQQAPNMGRCALNAFVPRIIAYLRIMQRKANKPIFYAINVGLL